MPPAYIVGQIQVHDEAAYQEYVRKVPATVAQYGGEYLARGGRVLGLEGAAPKPRAVLMRFPSYEQALAWYRSAENRPLAALRQSLTESHLTVVEGVD